MRDAEPVVSETAGTKRDTGTSVQSPMDLRAAAVVEAALAGAGVTPSERTTFSEAGLKNMRDVVLRALRDAYIDGSNDCHAANIKAVAAEVCAAREGSEALALLGKMRSRALDEVRRGLMATGSLGRAAAKLLDSGDTDNSGAAALEWGREQVRRNGAVRRGRSHRPR